MADFRPINSAEVAVDSPLTQQLFDALRQNPRAIIENDSSASNVPMKIGCMHTVNPQAGKYIIMESTGLVTDEENTGVDESDVPQLLKFYCRNKGGYKIKLDYRLGERSGPGSDDTGFQSTEITALVKHTRDGEELTTVITRSQSRSANSDYNNRTIDVVDVELEVGDNIILSTTGSAALGEASMTVQFGVSNQNAIFGADIGIEI